VFDYWCMPEFVKWVNGHRYEGGGLSAGQEALRKFYADLLALCQDAAVRGDGYWGLKYCHPGDVYPFARFEDRSGRLLLVAANFRGNAAYQGAVRIPPALAAAAGLGERLTIRLILDRGGKQDGVVAQQSRGSLAESGFSVTIPNQSCHVFAVS
jgi:hypothetical protein